MSKLNKIASPSKNEEETEYSPFADMRKAMNFARKLKKKRKPKKQQLFTNIKPVLSLNKKQNFHNLNLKRYKNAI